MLAWFELERRRRTHTNGNKQPRSPRDTRNESHLTQTPPLRLKVKVSPSVTSQRTRNLSSAFDPFRNNSVIEPPKSLTLNTTGSEHRGLNPQPPNLVARSPTQSYSQPYILPRIQLQPRALKRHTRSQSKAGSARRARLKHKVHISLSLLPAGVRCDDAVNMNDLLKPAMGAFRRVIVVC